jgi:Ca2+-binding RTX toxin-like protein
MCCAVAPARIGWRGSPASTAMYSESSVGVVVDLAGGWGYGGNAQDDTLTNIESVYGSQGSDTLSGSNADNTLVGNNVVDFLTGRAGKDSLGGSAGADSFVYLAVTDSAVGAEADRIVDFSHAEGDRIGLSQIDANAAAAGNQAFTFIGTGLYTNTAGKLRYAQSGGNTTIAGDVDGDGTSDFHIVLSGTIALVAGDFVL